MGEMAGALEICCRTAPRFGLNRDAIDLEVFRSTQRPMPRRERIPHTQHREKDILENEQLAYHALLLLRGQAIIATTSKQMVPSPSPRQREIHGFSFRRSILRRSNDIQA